MMNHTLRTISELEDLSAPLYFTVKNFIQSAYEEDKTAHVVVLCTQLSLDRLHSLYDLQRHWLGPISAVLYVKESDNIQDAEAHVMTFFKEKLPPNHRINLHLMFSQVFTTPFHANFDYDIAYPVNALRNLATMCAETEYVLSLDVDFVPSVGLYPFILKHAKSLRNFNKTAFVLPAFEWEKYDDSETLKSGPNMDKMLWDYNSLMEACLKGEAIPFRYLKRKNKTDMVSMRHGCLGELDQYNYKPTKAHRQTNYPLWFRSSARSNLGDLELYDIQTENLPIENCGSGVATDRFYEPYFIVRKDELVPFDGRLRSYSFNKRIQCTELLLQGIQFKGVVGQFVIHKPHVSSQDKSRYKHQDHMAKFIVKLYGSILQEFCDGLGFQRIASWPNCTNIP
jgi:hypothetical protein